MPNSQEFEELAHVNKQVQQEVQEITDAVPQPLPEAKLVSVAKPSGSHEDWMKAAGISASDYSYVEFIISHESSWRHLVVNSIGATGLCQALPGSKMATAGQDWQTNPITQLRWCDSYAKSRYGSWAKAYAFWISNRWW